MHTLINWLVLVVFFGGLLGLVVWCGRVGARTGAAREHLFFRGHASGRQIGYAALTASVLISWIMAKSVQNAAALGQDLGLVGSFAYGTYWLGFVVAGLVIFALRGQGFASLHQFLRDRFGVEAVALFSLLLLIRLWNEIWSNTIVVAQPFGEPGSFGYYAAAWAATGLVLVYSLIGGFVARSWPTWCRWDLRERC